MSQNEQIDHLFKRIDNFVKTPTKDLISNIKSSPAGNITFNELELEINQLKEILSLVTKESLTALPSYKMGEFEVLLSPLFSGINQIQNFKKDPRVSDEQQKSDIVQSFLRQYDSSNPNQSGFIARNKDAIWQLVTTAKALSFEDINKDLSIKEAANREKQWSLYQEQIKNDALTIELLKDELQKSVELVDKRYKDIAQKGEFLAQEAIFRNEAEKQQSKANWWLVGIVLAVLIIIAILAFIIDDFCFSTDCFKDDKLVGYEVFCQGCGEQVLWYKLVKAIIFRVFLLSMSVYLLLFTIKNYNAHMHIKAVNSHKENSFAAAIHLIGRTDTPEGKDKLIVQAATSIFSHQNTGHIGKDSEPNNPIFIDKVIDKLK